MDDDVDIRIIQTLFGAGVALVLVALMAFSDGEADVGLVALGLAVLGLAIVGGYRIVDRRQRARRTGDTTSHR